MRSLVGLIPLYAIEVLEQKKLQSHSRTSCEMSNGSSGTGPTWSAMLATRWQRRPVATFFPSQIQNQFKRLLERIWDPDEFLPHGIRSLRSFTGSIHSSLASAPSAMSRARQK